MVYQGMLLGEVKSQKAVGRNPTPLFSENLHQGFPASPGSAAVSAAKLIRNRTFIICIGLLWWKRRFSGGRCRRDAGAQGVRFLFSIKEVMPHELHADYWPLTADSFFSVTGVPACV